MPAPSVSCPACGARGATPAGSVAVSRQHALYFPAAPEVQQRATEVAAVTDYLMWQCGSCGLAFASPMVAPGRAWYEVVYRALDVKPEQRWEYGPVLDSLTAADAVYEIGCGHGGFLARCRDRGVRAFGIDFSPDAVDACRRQGLSAAAGPIGPDGSNAEGWQASVVVSFHVLEHLERPDDLFAHASAVSGSSSRLWVSVPSDRRISRTLGLRDPLDEPPHHLTKWTERACAAIGARNGWRLVNVLYEPFSSRSGLWSIASSFRIYDLARSSAWLRRRVVERMLRATLYPAAAVRLVAVTRGRSMSGLSMLAEYSRT